MSDETSNVIGMHGQPIATPGRANAAVVEYCRNLLIMAEAGEMCGISTVVNHADGSVTTGMEGVEDVTKTIGGLRLRSHQLERAWCGDE